MPRLHPQVKKTWCNFLRKLPADVPVYTHRLRNPDNKKQWSPYGVLCEIYRQATHQGEWDGPLFVLPSGDLWDGFCGDAVYTIYSWSVGNPGHLYVVPHHSLWPKGERDPRLLMNYVYDRPELTASDLADLLTTSEYSGSSPA